MSSNLVPSNILSTLLSFENISVPAALSMVGADEFETGTRMGYPFLSIKGKNFTLIRNDERTLVTKPNSDEPASALEVVVVRSAPGISKVYYRERYTEGSQERPDCFSNDGIAPGADSRTPQAKSCAACPHNQWGSRITDDGKKAKSCADSKRLVIAPLGQINDPMLLRVPATSLKNWDQYVQSLKRRGVTPPMVATKLSFDWHAPYPLLTFTALGVLPSEMAEQAAAERESETTLAIIDAADAMESGALPPLEVAEAPKAEAPKAEAPKAAPKKNASLEDVVAQADSDTPTAIPVEAEGLLSTLDGILDDLDDDEFDD